MDIGERIKEARKHAALTQEQVAEALDVSRQTISNWENSKSYPDIISVIKMSDLYAISLDCLLKEEIKEDPVMSNPSNTSSALNTSNMSNYLNYLEESTNVVKSRRRLSRIIQIAAYLVIWAASLLLYWFFTSPSDAMGYGLIVFYLVLPVTTFIVSFLIGRDREWQRRRWLMILFFAVMYMLTEYATFSLSYMLYWQKFSVPDFTMLLIGGAISLLGMAIGALTKRGHKHPA